MTRPGRRNRELAIGDVVGGRLEVRTVIGRGGGGTVYRVHDRVAGEERALKVLRQGGATAGPLLREAALLSEIRHPHLAQLHDVLAGPPPAFTMDLVEGADLAEKPGALGESEARLFLEQTLRTLAFLHGRGILHRDLKPGNLRVTRDGNAVILDLGLAEVGKHGGGGGGTPAWLAPEVLRGAPATPASDLFGLGRSVRSALSRAADAALAPVLDRMDALAPAARFATADEALAALAAMGDGGGTASPVALLLGPRIIGRDKELAALEKELGTLAAGGAAPPAIVVEGPAGSGRSRLLEAGAHRAGALGIRTFDLRTPAALARFEDLTAEVSGRWDLVSGDLAEQREKRAVLVAAALQREARDGPVAALLDAVRDPDLVAGLLSALGGPGAAARILAVVRAEPGFGDDLPAGDARRSVLRLLPGPLGPDEAGLLVLDALALPEDTPGAAEIARPIVRRTGGWPGPLLAALRNLALTGALGRGGGRPVLTVPEERIPASPETPESMAPLLDGLRDEGRRALGLIGCLARPMGPRLRELLGVSAAAVRDLLCRGLVTEVLRDGNEWVSAAVDADAAAMAGGTSMPALHAALADACRAATSELGPDAGALEVLHRHEAEPGPDVARAVMAAAEASLSRGDMTFARRLLGAVAAAGGSAAPEAARRLGVLLACSGSGAEALELIERVAARGSGAIVHLARGEIRRITGDVPGAVEALDAAMAGGNLPAGEEAAARRIRSVCLLQRGRVAESLHDIREALRLTPAAGRERVTILATLAQILHGSGETGEAERTLDLALGAADAAEGESGALRASIESLRGQILLAAGRPDAARDAYTAALRLFRDAGHAINLASTLNNLGVLEERAGRLSAALAAHEEALAIRSRAGDRLGVATSRANRGIVLRLLGRFTEARTELRAALGVFMSLGNRRSAGAALAELARTEAAVGSEDAARELASQALSVAEEGRFPAVEIAARLALGTALAIDPASDCGAPVAEAAEPLFRGAGTAERVERDFLRALAEARAGRTGPALALAAAALAAAESGIPQLVVRALLVLSDLRPLEGTEAERLVAAARAAESVDLRAAALAAAIAHGARSVTVAELVQDLRRLFAALSESDAEGVFMTTWNEKLEGLLAHLEAPADLPPGALDAILRISRTLSSERPVETLLEEILDGAISLAGAERGFIVLREEGGFACPVARGIDRRSIRLPKSRVSSTIVEDVLARGRAVAIADAGSDPRFREVSSVRTLRLSSVVCVPFTTEGRVRGALYLDHPGRADAFPPDRVRLLSAFADHAAVVLARAEKEKEIRDLNGRLQELLKAETRRRRDRETELRAVAGAPGRLVAESAAMKGILETAARVARTNMPVLIVGETGTGKDVIAREIHAASERSEGPFLTENCAAIPAGLLEAELFGSARGAFTGATEDRPGLLTLAAGGTLFLDEVGDLDPGLQSKLLRVLEEGTVRPLGSQRRVRTDFRLVAATNRPLEELRSGVRFRTDLFYRLSGTVISLPPLRERPEDAAAFIDRFLASAPEPRRTLHPDARRALLAWNWPGNFRELQNELSRAAALADGSVIELSHLSDRIAEQKPTASAGEPAVPYDLETLRVWALQRALDAASGDKDRAAELLGVARSTLYHDLKRYELRTWLRTYTRRQKGGGGRGRGGV